MKKNDKIMLFLGTVLLSLSMIIVGIMIQEMDCKTHKYAKSIVSIEYLEDCQCGGKMECYKSFVDYCVQKECKECGYYYNSQDK